MIPPLAESDQSVALGEAIRGWLTENQGVVVDTLRLMRELG